MSFELPTTAHAGRLRLIDDPVVQATAAALHHGDPTVGWAGDERLGLYFNVISKMWEVVRWGEDGVPYLICRSNPGASLLHLPRFLAEHDTRSRTAYDPIEEIAEAERSKAARDQHQLADAIDSFYVKATTHTGPAPARVS